VAKSNLVQCLKFRKFQSKLNISIPTAIGHLELLWQTGYNKTSEVIGNSDDVELAAYWDGKEGEFTRIAKEVGFIDEVDGVFTIHDFWDHCPSYVKRRKDAQLLMSGKPSVDESLTSGKPNVCPPQPNPTKPNQAKPKPIEYSPAFLEFWKAYPLIGRSRTGKDKCWEVWKKGKFEQQFKLIMKALSDWMDSELWNKDDGQYIKNPTTWLKDGKWKLTIGDQ